MIATVEEIRNGDTIVFSNGCELYADHNQDCCESHYLDFEHVDMRDFEGLEFDLSGDSFFKRIEDYGIALIPIKGYDVKIPGYGSNNGYYSANLSLVLVDKENEFTKEFDISECQDVQWQ